MTHALDDAFLQLVEPHRRELRLHCYRMLGSSHDSEDMMQETLVRAWRARGSLGDPSAARAWLYRIATNVCLDELKHRKSRPLPSNVAPAGDPTIDPARPDPEVTWLEPCPDGWLGEVAVDPGATYELKEGVALAFVAAMQCLSAQQRAVLLLLDVVGMPAEETATALGMSVSAADSTLHRARTAARERTRAWARRRERDTSARAASRGDDALLGRYIGAWQARDLEAFTALLHEDVVLNMPPSPTWLLGKAAVATFYAGHAFAEPRAFGFVPTGANGQPTMGFYLGGKLMALHVLRIEEGLVVEMHHFMNVERFGLFDLPDSIPGR
jgi:RNA polymerase sigma-70 factor (ECF subfamily)